MRKWFDNLVEAEDKGSATIKTLVIFGVALLVMFAPLGMYASDDVDTLPPNITGSLLQDANYVVELTVDLIENNTTVLLVNTPHGPEPKFQLTETVFYKADDNGQLVELGRVSQRNVHHLGAEWKVFFKGYTVCSKKVRQTETREFIEAPPLQLPEDKIKEA